MKLTYSYSSGRLLMPRSGGAIQPASARLDHPVIEECTNALSASLGDPAGKDFHTAPSASGFLRVHRCPPRRRWKAPEAR